MIEDKISGGQSIRPGPSVKTTLTECILVLKPGFSNSPTCPKKICGNFSIWRASRGI